MRVRTIFSPTFREKAVQLCTGDAMRLCMAYLTDEGQTVPGDGHYARPEAMGWCEGNGIQYVFGLSGSKSLSRKVEETADAVRTERAVEDRDVVRRYAETRLRAGSWNRERRAVARIEATRLGLDIRFVVTNVARGSAEWVYDSLYCARGQAENLIKLHKAQLRSDRTSCRSPLANQMRLVLHTEVAREIWTGRLSGFPA